MRHASSSQARSLVVGLHTMIGFIWWALLAVVVGTLVAACGSDEVPENGNAPGATGGVASGGRGTGGAGGVRSQATGGRGGAVRPDADRGKCIGTQVLVYDRPGCNVAPVCVGTPFEACWMVVCGCDGQTLVHCNPPEKPWVHYGSCLDGSDAKKADDAGRARDASDGSDL